MRKTGKQRPGSDPIIFHIHRLSRSIMRAAMAQYLHEFGLGVPQVQILNSLGARGPAVSKEIATYTAMNKALVSRSLSELTNAGFTVSSLDVADARLRVWKLTKKGEDSVAAFQPVLLGRRSKLLKVLTAEEQTLLTQFIDKLYSSSEALGRNEAAARRSPGQRSKFKIKESLPARKRPPQYRADPYE